jgi:hypothetical protein
VSGFTYTVFVIVASLIGALISLFVAGVVGVLFHDNHRPVEEAHQVELPRAA